MLVIVISYVGQDGGHDQNISRNDLVALVRKSSSYVLYVVQLLVVLTAVHGLVL